MNSTMHIEDLTLLEDEEKVPFTDYQSLLSSDSEESKLKESNYFDLTSYNFVSAKDPNNDSKRKVKSELKPSFSLNLSKNQDIKLNPERKGLLPTDEQGAILLEEVNDELLKEVAIVDITIEIGSSDEEESSKKIKLDREFRQPRQQLVPNVKHELVKANVKNESASSSRPLDPTYPSSSLQISYPSFNNSSIKHEFNRANVKNESASSSRHLDPTYPNSTYQFSFLNFNNSNVKSESGNFNIKNEGASSNRFLDSSYSSSGFQTSYPKVNSTNVKSETNSFPENGGGIPFLNRVPDVFQQSNGSAFKLDYPVASAYSYNFSNEPLTSNHQLAGRNPDLAQFDQSLQDNPFQNTPAGEPFHEVTDTHLRDTLRVIEHALATSENKVETPERMVVELMEHQKIGLGWMLKMEELGKGGLLADDMGLGKTIQILSLICEQKLRCGGAKATTLVVAPVSLIYQWEQELKQKTDKYYLRVLVYHGTNTKVEFNLNYYDVVITTYGTLTSVVDLEINDDDSIESEGLKNELGKHKSKRKPVHPIQSMHWTRIVLDEAHVIRNRSVKASRACRSLNSTYRWCLTGTPIQNKIDDIYPIIAFLGIEPFDEWRIFKKKFGRCNSKSPSATQFEAFNLLLKRFCLRRNKKVEIDGKPILNLPPKEVIFDEVAFSPSEAEFYNNLKENAKQLFAALIKRANSKKNIIHILALLLRLRQACLHPRLTTLFEPELLDETQTQLGNHRPIPEILASDSEADSERDESSIEVEGDRYLIDMVDQVDAETTAHLIRLDPQQVRCPRCNNNGVRLQVISPCGHYICDTCSSKLNSKKTQAKCQVCLKPFQLFQLISLVTFQKLRQPISLDLSDDESPEVSSREALPSDFPASMVKLYANFAVTKPKKRTEEAEQPTALEQFDCYYSPTSSKIIRLIEIIKETMRESPGDKTIVYSQFTSSFPIISAALEKEGIVTTSFTGALSSVERSEVVEEFRKKPIPVMLVSLQAGSVGLNLVMANRVIFMDMWWNPAIELQAIDRVHRIGQTKPIKAIRLITPDTIETKILELQQKKLELISNTVESHHKIMDKFPSLGFKDLVSLFRSI